MGETFVEVFRRIRDKGLSEESLEQYQNDLDGSNEEVCELKLGYRPSAPEFFPGLMGALLFAAAQNSRSLNLTFVLGEIANPDQYIRNAIENLFGFSDFDWEWGISKDGQGWLQIHLFGI